ncbi:Zinc finger-XS domain-containing protein [Artemisia annua]|uniref:Zinc finger-XS domain-containing protein n=1 Tax=Artemisia annua TaxID=35608 RepID=A0A2U1PN67_ARTAN|nr:Zinc finger-XS domain-containing protein [Artemisia annua]
MTTGENDRNANTDVEELNQGLGNMSLNSGKNGWEGLTEGWVTGDGSRREWTTWGGKKTGEQTDDVAEGDNAFKLYDAIDSDDEIVSDDYDSDDSQMSHDSRKKHPYFVELFESLDELTADQINEPVRQWHCPACRDGPGSIHWFRGMKAFVTHIKTKGSRRPKLHRDLADLLDEELFRRGAVAVQNAEVFGKWVGVDKGVGDWNIVWPPMVIVQNTLLEQDENEKWVGMGTHELLEYFDSFEAVKARNAFGPEGHRGMSVLIFDASAVGYLEAERLGKHFERQDLGRNAWNHHPNHIHSDGKRQLYGYLATEQDLEVFNIHSPGKLKLKYELVSYQEKVVNQYKQLSKDSQQLIWYKKMIAKQERSSKALEDAFWLLSQKLRKIEEENKIIRQRTQMYHKQNEEEMDFLEKFSKDQLKVLQDCREAQKEDLEKLQQEECKTVHAVSDVPKRNGKGENVLKSLTEDMNEIEEERVRLMKLHEEEMAEMKIKHGKEENEAKEKFNSKLDQLTKRCSQ